MGTRDTPLMEAPCPPGHGEQGGAEVRCSDGDGRSRGTVGQGVSKEQSAPGSWQGHVIEGDF